MHNGISSGSFELQKIPISHTSKPVNLISVENYRMFDI